MRQTQKMLVGEIVRIRLNPQDAMTCIDLVKNSGQPWVGMSLSQVISQALKGLCQYARTNGLNGVQTRDGFEYSEMVAPFLTAQQGTKIATDGRMIAAEQARVVIDAPAAAVHVRGIPQSHAPVQLPDHIIRKKGRVYTRILELQSKLEADPDNFTPADSEYLARLEDAISQMDAGQDIDVSKLL